MTENEESYRQTFSQREGKAPLPEPMRLEHISTDFRNLVWLAVDNAIKREIRRHPNYERKDSMYHIVSEYTIKVLHWPHDHIKGNYILDFTNPFSYIVVVRDNTQNCLFSMHNFLKGSLRCKTLPASIIEKAFR